MTNLQFGFLLTLAGGGLTMVSLGLMVAIIYSLKLALPSRS